MPRTYLCVGSLLAPGRQRARCSASRGERRSWGVLNTQLHLRRHRHGGAFRPLAQRSTLVVKRRMHPAEMGFAEYQLIPIPRELEATERGRIGLPLAIPQAELGRAQQ